MERKGSLRRAWLSHSATSVPPNVTTCPGILLGPLPAIAPAYQYAQARSGSKVRGKLTSKGGGSGLRAARNTFFSFSAVRKSAFTCSAYVLPVLLVCAIKQA